MNQLLDDFTFQVATFIIVMIGTTIAIVCLTSNDNDNDDNQRYEHGNQS